MSTSAARILVVEDDPAIQRFLGLVLEQEGFRVESALTQARGLIQAANLRPDLLVVDLGLPDGDGLHLIQQLRAWSAIPVIVLSARTREQEKVAALDAGADDFLEKPFGTGELLARVRAQLRRANLASLDGESLQSFGQVRVNLALRQVWVAGTEVHLTPIEYRLLTTFLQHTGKVLTHRQLLQLVWGPGHAERTHYLRVYMQGLRRKLEPDPARPAHFLTETGVGYRFKL